MRSAAVCVLHGGVPVPPWLVALSHHMKVYVCLNDADSFHYHRPANCPQIVYYANKTQCGFAENVNRMLIYAFSDGFDMALVLNFDLQLDINSLLKLAEFTSRAKPVCAAVLSDEGGMPTFSSGTYPTPLREFIRTAGLFESAHGRTLRRHLLRRLSPEWRKRNTLEKIASRQLAPTQYVPWTAICVTSFAWALVGPLDERFDLYAEDVDWGMRCAQAGIPVWLVNVGVVRHLERATRSSLTDALYEASHIKLHRKYHRMQCLLAQQIGLEVRRWLSYFLPIRPIEATVMRRSLNGGYFAK